MVVDHVVVSDRRCRIELCSKTNQYPPLNEFSTFETFETRISITYVRENIVVEIYSMLIWFFNLKDPLYN